MRLLLRGILAAVSLVVLSTAYLLWNNNRPVPPPGQDQLNTSLQNSIRWLTDHRGKILASNNPMVWRMVQQAGEVSGDTRLKALFADYAQRHLDRNSGSIWRPLFYPQTWAPVRFEDIAGFPYYNWHFLYAITCDRELAKVPDIAAQNDPAFCDRYPLRPACVTHQMMGLLLLKRSQCGNPLELDRSIGILQQRIRTQLTWDPRVVDVYMQRVLMLVESGAADLVKPVWLQQLIEAQQADGGWASFMPLVPLGGNRSIGITRLPRIMVPRSDFHMTAQGVLLFALLTHPAQEQ
ncbi:MAG TPA: hypothetical protein ENK49_04540 [Gammaproteobacteria bacterium]|nr:hypothetical protein [Gammaproteobacteria bacterium]